MSSSSSWPILRILAKLTNILEQDYRVGTNNNGNSSIIPLNCWNSLFEHISIEQIDSVHPQLLQLYISSHLISPVQNIYIHEIRSGLFLLFGQLAAKSLHLTVKLLWNIEHTMNDIKKHADASIISCITSCLEKLSIAIEQNYINARLINEQIKLAKAYNIPINSKLINNNNNNESESLNQSSISNNSTAEECVRVILNVNSTGLVHVCIEISTANIICSAISTLNNGSSNYFSSRLRSDYLDRLLLFYSTLNSISNILIPLNKSQRKTELTSLLTQINTKMARYTYFPTQLFNCYSDENPKHLLESSSIIDLLVEQTVILSSRDKAPFMIYAIVELHDETSIIAPNPDKSSINIYNANLYAITQFHPDQHNPTINITIPKANNIAQQQQKLASKRLKHSTLPLPVVKSSSELMVAEEENKMIYFPHSTSEPRLAKLLAEQNNPIRSNSISHNNNTISNPVKGVNSVGLSSSSIPSAAATILFASSSSNSTSTINSIKLGLDLAFGEEWNTRKKKLLQNYLNSNNDKTGLKLDVVSVIFKSGDNFRQELLAAQFAGAMKQIFLQANLPIYLYNYSVTVTGVDCGLIETLSDSKSIDSLKKSVSNFVCLEEFFLIYYGGGICGSDTHRQALTNFAESLAGYSLLIYLLNVKDRHNGNILLTRDGRIIHIDYGFMLLNSPGSNFAFESAPFKLTSEFLQVLGGEGSELFQYFQLLICRGFLQLRAHAYELINLIQIFAKNSYLPCFNHLATANNSDLHPAIILLKERLLLNCSEDECIRQMTIKIQESITNWRSLQYDYFQKLVNNIQ